MVGVFWAIPGYAQELVLALMVIVPGGFQGANQDEFMSVDPGTIIESHQVWPMKGKKESREKERWKEEGKNREQEEGRWKRKKEERKKKKEGWVDGRKEGRTTVVFFLYYLSLQPHFIF